MGVTIPAKRVADAFPKETENDFTDNLDEKFN